ncbi:unnamed protein product [Urochloa humidicola]
MEATSSSSPALQWWLTAAACSPLPTASSIPSLLAFRFFSRCLMHALLATLDLLFLLTVLVLALRARLTAHCDVGVDRESLLDKSAAKAAPPDRRHHRGRSFLHGLALAASAVQAAASLVLLVLTLLHLRAWPTAWRVAEYAFLAAHAATHLAAVGVITVKRARQVAETAPAARHPLHLRVLAWHHGLRRALLRVRRRKVCLRGPRSSPMTRSRSHG